MNQEQDGKDLPVSVWVEASVCARVTRADSLKGPQIHSPQPPGYPWVCCLPIVITIQGRTSEDSAQVTDGPLSRAWQLPCSYSCSWVPDSSCHSVNTVHRCKTPTDDRYPDLSAGQASPSQEAILCGILFSTQTHDLQISSMETQQAREQEKPSRLPPGQRRHPVSLWE